MSYSTNWNAPEAKMQEGGGYTRTRSGRKFWILNPSPEDFSVKDMAFSLSNVCRWGGHCDFYSVAQHAVMCARAALDLRHPAISPLKMLHHEASEAYMGDMVRPLKRGLPDYRAVEERMMQAAAKAVGFQWPMTEEEHALDSGMMILESRFLFPSTTREDFPEEPPFPLLFPNFRWSPREACHNFLLTHKLLA